MPPPLQVWDFDGTIADTREVILNSFGDVFSERGLGTLDPAAARATIGVPLVDAFARLLGTRDPVLLGELVGEYRRFFAARVAEEAVVFPGVAELIEASVAAGVTAAIATSRGRASLTDMLDRFGIGEVFTHVFAAEDVHHPKPHPEMVQRIQQLAGVAPDASVVIGDTWFDIEMGNRAGARTVAVTWGNEPAESLRDAHPDHVVDTVAALERLVLPAD